MNKTLVIYAVNALLLLFVSVMIKFLLNIPAYSLSGWQSWVISTGVVIANLVGGLTVFLLSEHNI